MKNSSSSARIEWQTDNPQIDERKIQRISRPQEGLSFEQYEKITIYTWKLDDCVNITIIHDPDPQAANDIRSVISKDLILIHVSRSSDVSQNDFKNCEVKLLTKIPKLILIIPFKFICFYAKSDSIFRVENIFWTYTFHPNLTEGRWGTNLRPMMM